MKDTEDGNVIIRLEHGNFIYLKKSHSNSEVVIDGKKYLVNRYENVEQFALIGEGVGVCQGMTSS
jgi:hypothetical protein